MSITQILYLFSTSFICVDTLTKIAFKNMYYKEKSVAIIFIIIPSYLNHSGKETPNLSSIVENDGERQLSKACKEKSSSLILILIIINNFDHSLLP
jgi:hypothetical protein